MSWHPLHDLAADIALGVIINNASRAAQAVQPATDGTTGPILNEALTFVGVLTGLKAAGQSSNNILTVITTIVDLIKVYGPAIETIIAAVLKILAGG